MRNHCMVWGFLFLMCAICSIAAAQSAPPRKDIPSIAKAANGSIVSIVMSDKGGKPVAQGSGFFVSKDGLVVTNYHVISEGSSAVVKLPDGAFYLVDGVLGSDKERDIAVIKAHGQNFRVLALGNSNRVQVGEEVVAIGNPLSLESTVSNGIVSGIRAVKEEGGTFLQITAPISPGSSGGPLFNMAGEVVGITTMYLKGGENLNFAIPINDAKRLLLQDSTKLQNLPNEMSLDEALKELHTDAEIRKLTDWMESFTNDNGNNHRGVCGHQGMYSMIFVGSTEATGSRLLHVTISEDTPNADVSTGGVITDVWFNLRDIDPDSISLQKMPPASQYGYGCGLGHYAFSARTNGELKITENHWGKKLPASDQHMVSVVSFDLNLNFGPKFYEVFKQAVVLANRYKNGIQ